MTSLLSVTETRNALRCPRVFALGRLRGQQVAFPLGTSSLGAAFHRIVETFARCVNDPTPRLRTLEAGADPRAVADALTSWLIELLVRELEQNSTYTSMPAEIDDLVQALHQFAAHVAKASATSGLRPAQALASFIASGELSVQAEVQVGPGRSVTLSGRADALHVPANGEAEVVEYKLTEDANEDLDRAQVALYRHLLRAARGMSTTPVILRFNPDLTTTRLAPTTADALVEGRLLPLVRDMIAWAEQPESAPPTRRTDLCAACPVRGPCAETYRDHLPSRDDPPSGASRPRPVPSGEVNTAPREEPPKPPAALSGADPAGVEEAAALGKRILAIFQKQGVPAALPRAPLIGARVIRFEVSAPRGKIATIDRSAEDVVHHLHSEDGVVTHYSKDGGLRLFQVVRRTPRPVPLLPLLERSAEWLKARPGRFVIGEMVDGAPMSGDLSDPGAAHLLVGGTTGSGKSVLLRALASSLAHYQSPSAIRFTLVDPKRVAFTRLVSGLAAHLSSPLCHDLEEALPVFEDLVEEMEDRYRLFAADRVQDLDEFNAARAEAERLPRHVVIVDEFQELIANKQARDAFVQAVLRLGAKARAAGIHLVLATQRPTKENVPTALKANLPGRIALQVKSAMESRIILDHGGAEALLGKGDVLVELGGGVIRGQVASE